MKKIFLLFIYTPFVLFSQINNSELEKKEGILYKKGEEKPFTGISITYYENGNRETTVEFKNGVLNGEMEHWYLTGEKQVHGKMHNGTKNGLWVSWFPNGNLKKKGKYKDNIENGTFSWYYENGNLKKKGKYKNGVSNGKWTWYFNNGNKESEGVLLNDDNLGKWTWWNENGEIIHQKIFEVEKPENFPKINNLLIGKWSFVKTIDKNNNIIETIEKTYGSDNKSTIKTNGPEIEIFKNGSYKKKFNSENTDKGNWILLSENEIEFQMSISPNSDKGKLLMFTEKLMNKKQERDNRGNFLNKSTDKIISLTKDEMKLEYENNYLQVYIKTN